MADVLCAIIRIMESGSIKIRDTLKILKKADIIFIMILIIVAVLLTIAQLPGKQADYLEVYLDNKLFGRYDLSKDQIIMINDGTILEISMNQYRLQESVCSEQYCVKQGWVKDQPIICVPQKLIITASHKAKHTKTLLTY
jgi:hypothetical protein